MCDRARTNFSALNFPRPNFPRGALPVWVYGHFNIFAKNKRQWQSNRCCFVLIYQCQCCRCHFLWMWFSIDQTQYTKCAMKDVTRWEWARKLFKQAVKMSITNWFKLISQMMRLLTFWPDELKRAREKRERKKKYTETNRIHQTDKRKAAAIDRMCHRNIGRKAKRRRRKKNP